METIDSLKYRIENNLTPRELELFTLYGNAKTLHEIADLMSISIKTVHSNRERIYLKLGFKNALELQFNAIKWVINNKED